MWSLPALELARDRALAVVGQVLGVGVWPLVPVRWNRRLRRAGRALIDGATRGGVRAARIELSQAYFEVYPGDLHGILVHEAVHVGLALVGLPFGHGPEFQQACREAGGMLHGRPMPGRVLRYRCPLCQTVLERRRPASGARWCAACVDVALARGADAYTPQRALVLVAVGFQGPESAQGGGTPPPPAPSHRGEPLADVANVPPRA